ncbi:helix-turn-helix transcriptional regulator [Henriciella litoralis]|uniref:helix-turn-helix transcriptional regulator n=1 Tax=Henriciella litoralis TaxID=568102 RepID=UPI0009FFD354|nr:helix-turn-helix transcriptional regulator [Henriciella litoralis]
MPVTSPLASVDDLVTSIYTGISENRPWQTFLKLLRERTNSEVASLSLRRGGNGVSPIVILDRRYEIGKQDARHMAREYALLVDQDPISATLNTPGKVTSLHELISPEELEQNAFFQRLMKPGGVQHYIGMCFGEPRGWRCLIRLMNKPDMPDYDETDRQLLRALHTHLETALSLFAELKRSRFELNEFHASLDRLVIGVFVLDGSGKLLDANRTARSIAARNSLVRVLDDTLHINNSALNSKFKNALERGLAAREFEPDHQFVETLRLESPAGERFEMLVRNVGRHDRFVGTRMPAVIVYISDHDDRMSIHDNLLEKLFGLTPTEARLAALLASGMSLTDAAGHLGVTENTVRKYSKTVYSKLGVHRQAELVRLILKSVAIFG